MRIDSGVTPGNALQEIGRRIAARRIELNLTQAQAAREAGLGKRTVERIETGEDCQLSTLVRLLHVLDLAEGLEHLVPEAGPSPMDLLKRKKRARKRASSGRRSGSHKPWQWGDKE